MAFYFHLQDNNQHIQRHMKYIHHPVMGDTRYGGTCAYMDTQEQVILSDSMSLENLEQKIKSAQADGDVMGEHDKQAEKTYEANAKKYPLPYCAVY